MAQSRVLIAFPFVHGIQSGLPLLFGQATNVRVILHSLMRGASQIGERLNELASTHKPVSMMLKKTAKQSVSNIILQEAASDPRLILEALVTALHARDVETFDHSERVVGFSLRLARELSLDPAQTKSLAIGALLHDIGKIRVPDAILRKPGKLTDQEWVRMRNHPLYGQQMLSGIEVLAGASRVVAQHHEKWDGSGYPRGLAGEEIDLNARIFAVADAFDAMISDRVYRAGKTYDAAAAELTREAGNHFDPQVVEAFHRISRQEWEELYERPCNEDSINVQSLTSNVQSKLNSKRLELTTRSVGMSLARRFNAGIVVNDSNLDASATIESPPSLTRRRS